MIRSTTAEGAFLNLVGAVLNGREPQPIPDGITADEIFAIGERQSLTAMTFCALGSLPARPACTQWADRQKEFLNSCLKSEIQMDEFHALTDQLCRRGVKIIPLKGCVLKGLYPAPELRAMSDVDLLYEGVSTAELAALMGSFGYTAECLDKRHHDVFYKKPVMNVEMHRTLISEESPFYAALADYFSRAVPDETVPNLYRLKPEDLYIHVIVHAAKHLTETAIGVRTLCDVYVICRKYEPQWDRDYIESRLQPVSLTRFEEKLRNDAFAFFGGEE